MIRLIWSSMLDRGANLTGSFLAVLIVVAAIYPAVILMRAGAEGPAETPRYGAVDLIVQVAPGELLGIDEDLVGARPRIEAAYVATIAAIDGVAYAASDLDFYAQLLDGDGTPVALSDVSTARGMPWSAAALAPFSLVSGQEPAIETEIVIDQALADAAGFGPGDEVTVLSQESPARYTIVGVSALPDAAGMERQATIFFTDPAAHRLANAPDLADRIAVILVDGADPNQAGAAIEAAIPGPIELLRGQAIARVDPASGAVEIEDFIALLVVMTGFVGFVAIFVIAATFGFSIQQRAREIGLQRAIGLTPGQVRRSIALEWRWLAVRSSARRSSNR